MPDNAATSSAGPALRGFRLQILYTLARLIEATGTLRATLYQPEAVEDLAIYGASGELLEAIQVKAYAAPLRLDDLEPHARNSLLRRVLATLRKHPDVRVRLASFGPIGPELSQAWVSEGTARENIQRKLGKAGYTPEDSRLLLAGLGFEEVEETDLTTRIEAFLNSHPLLAGQAEHALASLCQWLYGAAEGSKRLTYADLIDRVSSIGRYIQERAAHWQTWNTLIVALDGSSEDAMQAEKRLAEFRQGMAAGYRHIRAGCDIPRRAWLERMDQAFEKATVVIVRGASGQGKSALAYRYLHDYCAGLWRFQVRRIDNRQDSLTVASALSGHAKAIGVPVTVYLDVQPGDRSWTELIQLLAPLPNLRVLVTVREEDWRRASLSGAEVAFQDIALDFDEGEARQLYEVLESRGDGARFLSFDEAWRQFGGDGPLLEFVYLVTQTQTLEARLRQQVQRLRDEVATGRLPDDDLRLLALAAYASSLGARLDVQALRRAGGFSDLGRAVERLEREYLLRVVDAGTCLDGLHLLRSTLLVACICDGLTFEHRELARECLPLLPPSEIEVFLLHLAAIQSGASLSAVLEGWAPPTWAAAGGAFRALLWSGLRDYAHLCLPLIVEIRPEFGDGGWIYLDFDLAGLSPDTGLAMWKLLGDLVPAANQTRFQALLNRQPDKTLAFTAVRAWLASLETPPTAPTSLTDWEAVAEMSYWCGRWHPEWRIVQWLREVELAGVAESLPLTVLARLLLGRWQLHSMPTEDWLRVHHDVIASRFRRETHTAWIEEHDGVMRAHFLLPWAVRGGTEQAGDQRSLHDQAMARVHLLRGLFPFRAGYGCQGYGHRVVPMDFDDTTKTAIKPEILAPDWAVDMNATVLALLKWDVRLPDWGAYVREIWSRREAVAALLHELRRALEAHFRDQKKRLPLQKRFDLATWERLRDELVNDIPLPRQAVDRWGFVSESRQNRDQQGKDRQERLIQQFALAPCRDLLREQGEMQRALRNFLDQAMPYLFFDYRDRLTEVTSRALIESYVADKGRSMVEPHLVVHNLADFADHLVPMQQAFRGLFASRFPPGVLDAQDSKEREEALAVLRLWPIYLEQPRLRMPDPLGQVERQWDARLREVCRRIDRGLRELTSERLSGQRLHGPAEREGKPVLWLRVDTDDPAFLIQGELRIHRLLAETVVDPAWPHHLRQALIRHWHSVVIVPTYCGKRIGDWAWSVPLLRVVFGTGDGSWLNLIQHTVTEDVWDRLRIPKWQSPVIDVANDLFSAIGAMQILMAHLSDWLPLAQVDGCDGRVLQAYADKQAPEWSRVVQTLIDRLHDVLQLFLSLDLEQQSKRPFLANAASTISENFGHWLPFWSEETQPVLSVSHIASWQVTWKEHEAKLFEVYFGLLMDARGGDYLA